MDCPNCGAYNASSSYRCRRCGHILQPEAEESRSAERDESWETRDEEESWRPVDEPEPRWDTGRREEPEPEADPWARTGPSEQERRDEWTTGQPGPSTSTGTSTGPDIGTSLGPPPDIPNYLWQSIVVTLCCCWPVGIPAIVYAARVNAFLASGNYTGAQESSQKARNWAIAAVVVGLLFYVGFFCVAAFTEN
jgi:hypothetical protein